MATHTSRDLASKRSASQKLVRRVAFGLGSCVIAGLAFGPLIGSAIGRSTAGHSASMVALGLKFDGAETCKGSKCHSKGDDTSPPTDRGSENDIWENKDPHSKSFETLGNAESKAIGAKMGIADVTTSKDCISCHALDVPANLQGSKFNISEGNSCTSCHGPSEKYMTPHQTKGWTDAQRKANPSHDGLLKATGLYDTRVITARAELCTSCHLSIDNKLVAAGHPQPKFELHYYTEFNPNNDSMPWKHWTTDAGKLEIAKVWFAGQAACVKDAMSQLAQRATTGASGDALSQAYEQAMSHALVFSAAATGAGVGDLSKEVADVKAAKGNAAKLAPAATAAAAAAAKMMPAIEKMTPDAAAAGKMLAAVAGTKGYVTDAGADGHAQAAYAVYALASAIETAAGKDQGVVDELV
ncbi:MAG TPA: multiheme c-type cytochrome, partial [Tepidisphaeraceae bacterium]|nr:multiheme c-type cytochrome [Tepidisphaeraceae bacterium]